MGCNQQERMCRKMKKKILSLLGGTLLTMMLVPSVVFAADADGNGYNDADEAVIREMIKGSSTMSAKYGSARTIDWEDAFWSECLSWQGEYDENDDLIHYIRFVDFESVNITDFKGELDVSGLSKLDTLWCQYNPGLTSLKLPVNGDSPLSYLNCSDTGITALDVSAYKELGILYCGETKITELDVSKNLKLMELNCGATKISSLDVSNNLELEELICSYTDITELDLSGNKKIQTLTCSDAGISKLISPKGKQLTLKQALGGKLQIVHYDGTTDRVFICAEPEKGCSLASFSGIPSSAQKNGEYVEFTLDKNRTVSAFFIGVKATDTKTKSVVKIIGKNKVEYVKSTKGKAATRVTIPSSVTIDGKKYTVVKIANKAFYKYKSLKSVAIPSTVTRIGSKAFYQCTALKKITIPSKVKYIESKAFYGCKKLKTISIKTSKLTNSRVGSKAFYGISKTATITVPKKKVTSYTKLLRAKGVGSKATITKTK